MTASGAKFSLAIISKVDSWRSSSAEIAACTSGSVSARLPLNSGSALRRPSVCTAMLMSSSVRGGGFASGPGTSARCCVLGGSGVPDARVEVLADPLVEQTDVVLAGHQHAAVGVRAGVGGELAALGGVEVLLVDPVEQLDRAAQVLARGDDLGQVEPVAVDDRAVRRHRVHAMEDHVVGHEVDEDLRVH